MIDPKVLELAIQYGIPLAAAMGALGMAFHPDTAKEIRKENFGVCQSERVLGKPCVGRYFHGGVNTEDTGWNMNAAHFIDKHQPGRADTNKDNGTCLCVHCHILQHVEQDDDAAAILLLNNQTIRHYNWLRQFMPNQDPKLPIDKSWDEKPPLEWYKDFLVADDEGRYQLAWVITEEFRRRREQRQTQYQGAFQFWISPEQLASDQVDNTYSGD